MTEETKKEVVEENRLVNGFGALAEKISKLINVKSIVTLALTGVFSSLAINGIITGSEFLTVFTTIIAFYFGVQHEKNKDS